mmetsp:Transcript_7161/g.21636  ORF Transcript_7161/g.21636 Transcript_7161/m.21636 type:complete len:157 (-) Transcript_7161:214-684(-)
MLYISCLQPTRVSPALNNGRRASSQHKIKKSGKFVEEDATCQTTYFLDKPGCVDARMNEHEPCDASLACPLEPFDISKCLKRHKGVLKCMENAVRFTQRKEILFVSPLPGSTIYLNDEIVTDKMTKIVEDGARLRFANVEYVMTMEAFCPLAASSR